MQRNKDKKIIISHESSFTFIELLAAIVVLAIGVLSVIAVSAKSYATISLQKNKLIAINLVREGIELVKNVRNENWLYIGSSYCALDATSTNCSEGRIKEDNSDCDWRCGSKDTPPDNSNFFRLEQGWIYNSVNKFFKDIQYNSIPKVEDASVPPTLTCKDYGDFLNSTGSFYVSSSSGFFKRLIIINRDLDENGDGNPNNDLQVIVKVCWRERGGNWEEVQAEEHLFNWYKPSQ